MDMTLRHGGLSTPSCPSDRAHPYPDRLTGDSALASRRLPRMDARMPAPDPNSQKPGFIGENPRWAVTSLAGFAIVAVVLYLIIVIFQ